MDNIWPTKEEIAEDCIVRCLKDKSEGFIQKYNQFTVEVKVKDQGKEGH